MSCGENLPFIQCNNDCTGYPSPDNCGGFGGGYGVPPTYPGYPGGPGNFQAMPAPPSWPPIPMTAQPYGGLVEVAQQMAGQAAQWAQAQLESRRLCSPWKTDGLYDTKYCCTPSIGRGGIQVAGCIKITRPTNPWASQGQLQLTPGAAPYPIG